VQQGVSFTICTDTPLSINHASDCPTVSLCSKMFKATLASTASPDFICIGQGTASTAMLPTAQDLEVLHAEGVPGADVLAAGPL
jgi:hypothetical protein